MTIRSNYDVVAAAAFTLRFAGGGKHLRLQVLR